MTDLPQNKSCKKTFDVINVVKMNDQRGQIQKTKHKQDHKTMSLSYQMRIHRLYDSEIA